MITREKLTYLLEIGERGVTDEESIVKYETFWRILFVKTESDSINKSRADANEPLV